MTQLIIIDCNCRNELLLTNGINNREYYPYFTANQVNVPTTANVNISDLDSADIIMGKEPTYTGEVNMEPELLLISCGQISLLGLGDLTQK